MSYAIEPFWRQVVDSLPLPIWAFDQQHRLLGANAMAVATQSPQAERLDFGSPFADTLRLLAFRGVLGPGDPGALVERHLAVDRSQPFRRLVRDRDGQFRDLVGGRLPDGGFYLTALDLTAPYTSLEEAQARAQTLERILARLQSGVAVFDGAARLVEHNVAYEELMALPRGWLRPGCTRADIMREMINRGLFLGLDDLSAAAREAGFASTPARAERERVDGRLLSVSTEPVPGGGTLVEVADITPMRRAEQRSQHRAALLDGVLEAMPQGVVVTGPDGRVSMVNAAHRDIFEGEFAARVGEHRSETALRRARLGEYGPGDPQALADQRVFEARPGVKLRRTRPNGQVLELRYAGLPDGGHVQLASDITALVAAQREAQERSALLQTMLDNMRHGIAMFGPDRRLVAANPLAETLIGLPRGRLAPGRHFSEVVSEQAALGEFSGFATASVGTSDRTKPLHYFRVRPDGAVIEVISDPTPEGGFVVTYTDITARRVAEHAAAQRAATLQAMLDHSRHGIAMYDAQQRLVAANALFASTTSIPRERLVAGAALADLLDYQAAHGGFGVDADEASIAEWRERLLNRREPARSQRRLADGRVLAVASDPTPDGGWVVTHSDVTALVEAETEARARAALLQTTLDHINHSIVLYGADRRVLLANRLAASTHGIPALEARQGTTFETLIEEQRALGIFGEGEAAAATAAEVTALDRSKPQRYQRVLPDGRIIAIASDPTPDGGFVVTNTDVSALRRAEAEASSRAAILTVMLDNMRHGICLFDREGRVVAANDLALRLTGLDAADFVPGVTVADLGRRQIERGEFPRAEWRDGAPSASEVLFLPPYRRVRPDGAIVEVVTAPTPEGGFVRTYTDVTPLAAAEAEARRRGDIQQVMLDHIRHGILLVDAAGRVVAANPKLRQLLDLPAHMVEPGVAFDAIIAWLRANGEFGPEPEAGIEAQAIAAFDRREPLRMERTRPNGTTHDVISDPTPDGGFILSISDVTEQRRSRIELERARDAAEVAHRAKSRFLATMSHELRTPLNAVIGFSEAIRAEADQARKAGYLDSIQEAGRHLLALIDDILDVARADTLGLQLQVTEVSLADVVQAAARVLGGTAEAGGVALEIALPANLPRVQGDALRLRQVLLNLVSNAIKFTPAGGKVTVTARLLDDSGLELAVIDTGIGMAPADIPRAFEPFVQIDSALSRRFPGSGLGLHLSRTLARAHGAELTLESAPGQGTTARLRFMRVRSG